LRALTLASSDIDAVTGDGAGIVLEKAGVTELGEALRGNLLLTGSEGCDVARRVLNAASDKNPALSVQPSGVADIQHALTFALARRVLNASPEKYPPLTVQPSGVADIQHAVTCARERGLLLAVKCGGRSWSGKSACDGGMLIDLSTSRHVRVGPKQRRAYVAG